ncbi:MAG: zinc-ribbon domain containing protein [Planctomycetota bacterium]
MTDATQGEDKLLICVDCHAQFAFTARDQAFYQQRGYQAPHRCRDCRDKRKSTRSASGAACASGAASSQAQFKVTCATCGLETTVSFNPNPDRPVYCRSCYLNRLKSRPS